MVKLTVEPERRREARPRARPYGRRKTDQIVRIKYFLAIALAVLGAMLTFYLAAIGAYMVSYDKWQDLREHVSKPK